jgi:hypothetical protein
MNQRGLQKNVAAPMVLCPRAVDRGLKRLRSSGNFDRGIFFSACMAMVLC